MIPIIRHQAYSDITPVAAPKVSIDDLIRSFSFEEAVRIAYVPIILSHSAFQYADFARRICAEKRLPFQKESRIIRAAIEEYERMTKYTLSDKANEILNQRTEEFTDEAEKQLQILWYTVSGQLKKEHPEVANYDLLTNLYMAVALLDYVRRFELSAGMEIAKRVGTPYASSANPLSTAVRNACLSIAGEYTLQRSDMLERAVRSIALRVDKIIEVEFK